MTTGDGRLAGYSAVSTALALLSDRRLAALMAEAPPVFTGIGGTAVLLEVEGRAVFVKRVPLTDLERLPEHVMSTVNMFQLPTWYQYGIGSAGFGVWRELAAHTMTTNWVLEGRCESFPLLYHWRVLPGEATAMADLDQLVEYWDGSPAVRQRLEAIVRASASVMLFLEYVPQTLRQWLDARIGNGLAPAYAAVERNLVADVSFMNANGLLHLDAHFGNILTDGRRLYFTDFGLATSPRFELSAAESSFVERNASHDACFAVTSLVNWLVSAVTGLTDPKERNAFVRRWADGGDPPGVPDWAADVIRRHAPTAAVVNEFYWTLRFANRQAPYPATALPAGTPR